MFHLCNELRPFPHIYIEMEGEFQAQVYHQHHHETTFCRLDLELRHWHRLGLLHHQWHAILGFVGSALWLLFFGTDQISQSLKQIGNHWLWSPDFWLSAFQKWPNASSLEVGNSRSPHFGLWPGIQHKPTLPGFSYEEISPGSYHLYMPQFLQSSVLWSFLL